MVPTEKTYDRTEDSDVVAGREPCPDCGSKDNLVRYKDGHAHCFSPGCGRHEHGEGEPVSYRVHGQSPNFVRPEELSLGSRKVSSRTAGFFGYGLGSHPGSKAQGHVYSYYDDEGNVVAQKWRFADKTFAWTGQQSKIKVPLFGAHLWTRGRKLVITEGEIDAMSVAECEDCAWPVVSLPNGAGGAKKAIQQSLEYLENFEEIILMFDNDEPGRKAAVECAMLLPPGKAKIARLQLKDASEMLQAGRVRDLLKWKWDAQPYRPDCIIAGDESWEMVSEPYSFDGIRYPWEGINDLTFGMRKGELVTWTAGSGIGKSSICREIAYHLMSAGFKVGYIALEEEPKKTFRGIMGVAANLPLTMNHVQPEESVMREAFDKTLGTGRIVAYNHFGSIEDMERFLFQVRYMVLGLECDFLIVDHLSMMVSGLGDTNERLLIDKVMTKLRTLVQETNCGMHLVSHLKRPSGTGHENGAITELSQLRGSHAIAQISDIVVGVERNTQDETLRNITMVRVLKNRYSGLTGVGSYLEYDPETGRLNEVSSDHVEALVAEAEKEKASKSFEGDKEW